MDTTKYKTKKWVAKRDHWRLMRVRATPELFGEFVREGAKFELLKGIPPDAEVVGGGFDFPSRAIELYVRHRSFDEVIQGHTIPIFSSITIKDLLIEEVV